MPNPNAQEKAEKIANVYCESHNHQGEFKSCGLVQDIAAELEAYAGERVAAEIKYQGEEIHPIARAQAAAEEREACAKVCDSALECGCAERIRSRGEA